MAWTVGELARAGGVSVRTLHHWDDIGLLSPSARSRAGHRLYDEGDLARLQRVLGYRELGFRLDQVARLLDDPDVDHVAHLRRQHTLLVDQAARLTELAEAVARAVEARQMGIELTPDELREVFGDRDPTEHAAEAEERWGDTDAYRESHRRTSSYRKADWQRLRAEQEDLEQRFAHALRSGLPADGPQARALAEEHRAGISRWFYDCPPGLHRALAEMYVADERFGAHYDRRAAGLAQYVRDAICSSANEAGRV